MALHLLVIYDQGLVVQRKEKQIKLIEPNSSVNSLL